MSCEHKFVAFPLNKYAASSDVLNALCYDQYTTSCQSYSEVKRFLLPRCSTTASIYFHTDCHCSCSKLKVKEYEMNARSKRRNHQHFIAGTANLFRTDWDLRTEISVK